MKEKIKLKFKKLTCRHESKPLEEGDEINLQRDDQRGPYLLKKCIKCGKYFKDYNIFVD